jgi:hypothetical protein
MTSLRATSSWVIIDLKDNTPLFETFSQVLAENINKRKYKAIPILEYLQQFNENIRKNHANL